MPVPYLWGEVEEFKFAKYWKTKPVKGGIRVVDENQIPVSSDKVVDYARSNLKEVDYILKQK